MSKMWKTMKEKHHEYTLIVNEWCHTEQTNFYCPIFTRAMPKMLNPHMEYRLMDFDVVRGLSGPTLSDPDTDHGSVSLLVVLELKTTSYLHVAC